MRLFVWIKNQRDLSSIVHYLFMFGSLMEPTVAVSTDATNESC